MMLKIKNDRGGTSTLLVIIVAAVLLSQMASINAALVMQARRGAQIREAYDSTYILENLAIYIQAGRDNYLLNGNQCPANPATGQHLIGANNDICVVPVAPGCDGIVYKGALQCLNGNGNGYVVGENGKKATNTFVAERINLKQENILDKAFILAQPVNDYVLSRLAVIGKLELNFLSKHKNEFSEPIFSSAIAQSAYPNSSPTSYPTNSPTQGIPSPTYDHKGTPGWGTMEPIAPGNIATFNGPLQLTNIQNQDCNLNTNCGRVGICPSWMHGTCVTQNDQMTIKFRLTQ
jgi:hypothetical protein